jgi:dipeptidyl aminopeptidase/acylaminoacyl peptidase
MFERGAARLGQCSGMSLDASNASLSGWFWNTSLVLFRAMRLRLVPMVVAIAVAAATSAHAGSSAARYLVVAYVSPAAADCPSCSVALAYDSHGRLLRTVRAAPLASLSWSPDGSLLAVVTRGGVSVEHADGTDSRQLVTVQTACPVRCATPLVVWSPDSRYIAVGRVDPQSRGFVLVDVATGQVAKTFPTRPDRACDPVGFSPNGLRLAYVCGGIWLGARRATLVVARANGALPRVVIHIHGFGPASWSPDSSRFAFTTDGEHGSTPFAIVDIRSGKLHKLNPHRAGEEAPTWSPNGSRLALAQYEGPAFTVAANGTAFRSLGVHGVVPVWLPDGNLLLATGPNRHSVLLFRHGQAPGRMLFRLPKHLNPFSIQEAR